MADAKLERFRQLKREEEAKRSGTNRTFSSGGDNASYPFWNIPENSTAVIRFLPDKDDDNPWFWSERQTIKLPFAGTINGESPTDRQVIVTVPCVDMFGDVCPIIAETKPWWKDESKKEMARLYYKKRSFICQGFVVTSPLEEQNVPENPIRRLMVGPELKAKLEAGMSDIEMENFPTDYMNGTDFKIRKTKKGGKDSHNSYATSEFSRRSRPLSEAEAIALEQHGLFNLADFRGARPDADTVAAIKAMFQASLRGDPYDFSEFGKYPFKPYGGGSFSNTPDTDTDELPPASSTSSVKVEKKVDHEADAAPAREPQSEAAPATGSKNSQDLLAKLRERTSSRS